MQVCHCQPTTQSINKVAISKHRRVVMDHYFFNIIYYPYVTVMLRKQRILPLSVNLNSQLHFDLCIIFRSTFMINTYIYFPSKLIYNVTNYHCKLLFIMVVKPCMCVSMSRNRRYILLYQLKCHHKNQELQVRHK